MAKKKAAPLAPTPEQRRAAWLAARRQCITSTDVAALLGVKPGASQMTVWLDKRGELAVEQTERMEWGNRLQEAILIGYGDRTGRGVRLADPYELIYAPDLPILAATLDATVVSPQRAAGVPVDAKNVGWKRPGLWGAEGTDEIPDSFLVQLTVQMMVTGAQQADLAVLFGGNRLEVFTVALNDQMRAIVREVVEGFYERHVRPGVAPPVDGGAAWTERLAKAKQGTDLMVQAGPTEVAAAARLAQARAVLAAVEAEEATAENVLKAAIGGNAGIVGPTFRATFKAHDRTYVDWEALTAILSRRVERLERRHKSKTNLAALVQEHTRTAPVRRFLFTTEGEDDA